MPGMKQRFRGEGSIPCAGTSRGGMPCGFNEIEGLEFCLHHVPDELLDEAEDITGYRRCRERFGQPDACRFFAVEGTDPPQCKNHGANNGSVLGKRAAANVIEGRVVDAATRLAAEHEPDLDNPRPIGNPLEELLDAAALASEWERQARRVMKVLQSSHWRYQTGRIGEQTRAELLLWERALDRRINALEKIARLNIAGQLAGIRAETMQMLDRAVTAALAASGASLEGQDEARKVLKRELRVIEHGAA